MSYITNFPAKLKALRALNSKSQQWLSQQTGIQRTLMIEYERGRAFPGDDHLRAIEDALGIKFNQATEDAFATLAPQIQETVNGN